MKGERRSPKEFEDHVGLTPRTVIYDRCKQIKLAFANFDTLYRDSKVVIGDIN